MRRFACTALTLAAFVTFAARADKPRKSPPVKPAAEYPLHETHADEHVTIAAEPGDIDETQPNTRLDYYHHGFLPIRVIITNNSDKSLSLDDCRIHLVTADSTVLQAATDEELQRRLVSGHSSETKIPLPMPLPSITIHHPPVDQKILADDRDFGFSSTVVEPHTTSAGYLYFDTKQVDDPVLEKATLEVRRLHYASSGKDFYAYEIPLKPTAAPAKSTTPATPAAPAKK